MNPSSYVTGSLRLLDRNHTASYFCAVRSCRTAFVNAQPPTTQAVRGDAAVTTASTQTIGLWSAPPPDGASLFTAQDLQALRRSSPPPSDAAAHTPLPNVPSAALADRDTPARDGAAAEARWYSTSSVRWVTYLFRH